MVQDRRSVSYHLYLYVFFFFGALTEMRSGVNSKHFIT